MRCRSAGGGIKEFRVDCGGGGGCGDNSDSDGGIIASFLTFAGEAGEAGEAVFVS